jgi:3-hydroxyacyl-CoA dehydrogenase
MHPYIAKKESTGLIFNRLWAAIKREILYILAEGVSEPEEVERLWLEMWQNSPIGPVRLMDQVGLDTVSFIEQHYVQERHLPTTAVDFLKGYIDSGKLGAKSGKADCFHPARCPKLHLQRRTCLCCTF